MTASVGINLLWLVPDQVGGSEQSTVATVTALRDLAPADLELRLFVLEPFVDAHPDVVASLPVEVLPLSGRSRLARIAGEATWLAARTRRVDLVHHAGGTAPPLRGAPYVLTVHDLQPLERQATHGAVKRGYLGIAVPRSVRTARAVAVPSEHVRQSVLARTGVEPHRVVAIPHGVTWPRPGATAAEELRRRHGIAGPFVLYPAITYPHKNHATLVEAFAQVHRAHPDAALVLPGAPGSYEEALRDQVRRLGLQGVVHRLGRIPQADVDGLFAAATVVAVPSRYEGFGLPAAEGLAAGVPVVASEATALPEVVGEAGRLVPPDDVDGWASALSALLGDPDERARLAARGLARAQRYTWAANAAAFADLYRAALRTG